MSVKERIKYFAKSQNMAISEFEKSISASNGYVNSISKSIGLDKINSILEIFPILSIEWLLTGQGSMLRGENGTIGAIPAAQGEGIPLIPIEAIAGFAGADNEGVKLEDCERYKVPEFAKSGAEFIIRVNGSSMYPKYSSGDMLACKKITDILFFQWGKVYVIDSSQGQLVKRICKHETPELITLVSDNKDKYPPFDMPVSDIRGLSIVLGVIRME